MLNEERFKTLLDKYTNGSISDNELEELFVELHSGSFDDLISSHMMRNLTQAEIAGNEMRSLKAQEILSSILSQNSDEVAVKTLPIYKFSRWMAAAVAIVALSITLYFLKDQQSVQVNPASQIASLTQSNSTLNNQTVGLPDGTVVTLYPLASISYPSKFISGKREVKLKGKAFFNVKKDAINPFFVYHDGLITHVLGTSFLISQNLGKSVTVSVVTGRVQVYKPIEVGSEKPQLSTVLYPNQKVVYNVTSGRFKSTLVENPLPVESLESIAQVERPFVFDEAPLTEVLTMLEKTYLVKIQFSDKQNFVDCHFTGDISGQGLYEKLDLICKSVNATYQLEGTTLIIKGDGCK